MKTQLRFWHFYISLPPNERNHRANKTLGIVAPDIHEGLKIIADTYPGATIWSVTHRGEVNHSVLEYPPYTNPGYHNEDKPH